MRRALYERGEEILDFRLEETSTGYIVPSYELKLDVVTTDYSMNNFRTNNISEEEFNK